MFIATPIMSQTLKSMLETRIGFRNEQYGNSGVVRIKDIIEFEIGSLGNTDIPHYLNHTYQAGIDLNIDGIDPESLKKQGFSELDIKELIFAEESERAIQEYRYFSEKVMEFLTARLHADELYGIWLTSLNSVLTRYSDPGGINHISEYRIPVDSLPISDLGEDGTLFVVKVKPKELLKF